MNAKGLHGTLLVLTLFLASFVAAQAHPYAFVDAQVDEALVRRVDDFVRDMQDANLPFTFELHQLCSHEGKASDLPQDLSLAEAAGLFDQLDVHVSSQHISALPAKAIHGELVERIYKHSPNGNAQLRHLATLRCLFPDGGTQGHQWQAFRADLAPSFGERLQQFLVFHRATGLCYWVEMD